MDMPQLLLVPGNPQDLTPDELAGLVEDLSDDYSTDVAVTAQRGYGVTWWEVLIIYVAMKGADAVVGRFFDEVLNKVESATKAWLARRRDDQGTERPFFLAVYKEDGEILKALEIRVEGNPVDVTERERAKGKRPRPDAVDGGHSDT